MPKEQDRQITNYAMCCSDGETSRVVDSYGKESNGEPDYFFGASPINLGDAQGMLIDLNALSRPIMTFTLDGTVTIRQPWSESAREFWAYVQSVAPEGYTLNLETS